MLTKLGQEDKVQAMFKALEVFRVAVEILLDTARIKVALSGGPKERERKQRTEQVEALVSLQKEVQELVENFKEQHQLVQEMVERAAKEVERPESMPILREKESWDEEGSLVFDVMLLAADLGADGLGDAEHKLLRDCYDALLHWDDAESKDKREESLWPIVNS